MTKFIHQIREILKKDKILGRVLRNTGYLFSSTTISLGLSFLQSIFAARLLGLAAFGLIGIITSLVSNVNRLFSFRMGEFVIRYLGKELTEENTLKAGALVKVAMLIEGATSILAFVCLQLIAPLGAEFIAKDMSVVPLIRLFGVTILANGITETSIGFLQITNHFRTQAAINLVQSLFTAIFIFLAFLFQGSLTTVLLAYLFGKVILGASPAVLALYHLPRHLHPGWWKAPLSLLPPLNEIAQYTLSTNFSGTIKMVVSESEPLWVGYFLNNQAVGLYKLGLAIVNPLMMPITPFISTTFPELTRSIAAKKWSQLKQLLQRVTLISAAWTGLVFLGMLIAGEWVIGLVYGVEFVPAYPTTMILLLGFGFSNIFFWNRSLLLAFGKANWAFYVLLVVAVLKTTLGFWVVPRFGIEGEAVLLSGNFILSVGFLVLLGLWLVREKQKVTS